MSGFLSNVGGFVQGFGQGVWGGAKGMVQGLGNIAEGAYGLATDSNARAQAWNSAVNAAQTAEWAVQNPSEAASDVAQGATNLYNNFVTAEQQAEANGQGAQFWGNVAGQGAFAVGTVLLPGVAEAKLAGAAGELGDAAEGLGAASALSKAAPALGDASALGETADAAATASTLPDPAALSFVPENSGVATTPAGQAWRDYQAGTIGSDMDPLTGEANVPALQFDNPNPNGNPYVKWDGYQALPDGTTELIDAKTAISPFSTADGPFIPQSTLDQLVNKSAALDQNPGYSGVLEVPNGQVAQDAQNALDQLGITNLDVRVRPFADATDTAAPDAALTPEAGTAPIDTGSLTAPSAANPYAMPNAGNLFGAGLLGADALGNLLSPTPSQPDAAATDPTLNPANPLFSVTYGVNPDGSLTTLSPPALVSPGDGTVTPPQPAATTDAAPPDTTAPAPAAPAPTPPAAPPEAAAPAPQPAPAPPVIADPLAANPLDPTGTDPLISDPLSTDPLSTDPLNTDPLSTDPLTTDPLASTTVDTTAAPVTPDPIDTTADPTSSIDPSSSLDSSAIGGGGGDIGGGDMADMAMADC